MNTIWFDDFLALAVTRNFSRAAEERHVTQPAFGRRIRALEDWLGVSLFDRSSQPVQLTVAGQWFEGVARSTLGHVASLPREAQEIAASHHATLKLAATHALSFTFVPTWLRTLETHLSLSPIQLISDVLPRCDALLGSGEVHFTISHSPVTGIATQDGSSRLRLTIGSDTLMAVSCADTHGHALHSLNHVVAAPFLAYSPDSGLGQILQASLSTVLTRIKPQAVFTAHLASALRSMALAGRGMAWLPYSLISDDLKQGLLVRAAPPDWDVALDIRLTRRNEPLGANAESFWAALI